MNKIKAALLISLIFTVASLSGCQTVPKKFREEVGGIKTRVETLESRVEGMETKQAEVERATGEQAQAMDELRAEKEQARTNISVKSRGFKGKKWTKEIQLCLKNAGFYDGEIDGIKGKRTRKAIRAFQEANGLSPDGIVGKKTWEVLSKHSQAAGSLEEGATK